MTTGRINQIAIHGAGISSFVLLLSFEGQRTLEGRQPFSGTFVVRPQGADQFVPSRCVFANRILLQAGPTSFNLWPFACPLRKTFKNSQGMEAPTRGIHAADRRSIAFALRGAQLCYRAALGANDYITQSMDLAVDWLSRLRLPSDLSVVSPLCAV